MNRRLGVGTVTVVVLASLLSGCGDGGSSPHAGHAGHNGHSGRSGHQSGTSSTSAQQHGKFQPTSQDFASLRTLVARRAHAVLHHDRHAFMATVDTRSQALVSQQRTLYANLVQLPLASLSYVMDPSVELLPAKVAGTAPTLRPQVYEDLKLRRTFDHPMSNALVETFVDRAGQWLLGAESSPKDNGQFDSAQERPWFGHPIAVRHVGAMTVLTDRARRVSLASLTSAVHDDILFDSHQLGIAPSFRILVDATSNGNVTSLSALSKEEAAAVTFPLTQLDPKDSSTVKALAGHAIKINPRQVAEYAANTGILRHELTHYLLHAYTGTNPKWLVEGIATWMQYYPDTFTELGVAPRLYHRLMTADRRLPGVGLFYENADVDYPISQAAVAWLVSHYGMHRLIRLMKAYSAHYQGVNVDGRTPRMLHLVYGITPRQLVRGAFSLLASLHH